MTQLQARYPNASLIAEFVTIHHESFVVRALVQVGGITLATGMAAATQIEQAEDRAKARALAALGIGNLTAPIQSQPASYPLSSPTIFDPSVEPTVSKPHDGLDAEAATNSLANSQSPSPLTEPLPTYAIASTLSPSDSPLSFTTSASFATLPQTDSDRSEYEFSYEPESYELESYESQPYEPEADPLSPTAPALEMSSPSVEATEVALSTQTDEAPSILPKTTAPTGKGKSKRKAEQAEAAPSPVEENDRSEEIAKIGLEMKRLGWTTEQGRNYLKRTYGKRSRQELDDAELIDFLRYLEAQVSPSESPF